MNIKLIATYLSFVFLISISAVAQSGHDSPYLKYIDSANNRIDNFPKLANTFLDSILEPLDKNIKGRIAEYYHLKAIASSHLNLQAEVYHYNILALKYAEKENNYGLAGASSLELFYNLYIVKKDSTAFDYLEKAKNFYKLDNNDYGLTEVMQMHAFVEFSNSNYEKSNALIIPELEHYQSIEDDQYYYMYALFMLTSNYIHLDDAINYRKYFKTFKSIETDTTIAPYLYKKHEVTLYNCMAEMHLEHKVLDSTLYYLEKSGNMHEYMNSSDVENYFKNYIDYYDASKNIEAKRNYIDSLKIFQQNLIKETVDASFNINKTLLETTQNLTTESKKKTLNRNWIIVLVSALIALIVFVFIRYKKIRKRIDDLSKGKKDYEFLQNNHEKLKVKVKGMEGYISEVKKEVKNISSIADIKEQHNRVKELYKNIHHNSSTLLSKSENHLDLINELNADFFYQLSAKHPELNSSEKIVCYYLFMGFKSKEIAAFINTSTRAVESKRYRVSSKLNIKNTGQTLVEYLTETFKVSKIE